MSRLSAFRQDVRDIAALVDEITYTLTHSSKEDKTYAQQLHMIYESLHDIGKLPLPEEIKLKEAFDIAKTTLYVGTETESLYTKALNAGEDLERIMGELSEHPRIQIELAGLRKNRKVKGEMLTGRPALTIFEYAFELKIAYDEFTTNGAKALINHSEPLESEGPIP